jgi:hypothetical protein
MSLCSGTLDLVSCTALLTSDDLMGFDVGCSNSTGTLLKPDHVCAEAWLSKRDNQVPF